MSITRRKLILGTAAMGAASAAMRSGLAADTAPSAAKAFTVEDTKAKLVQVYASKGSKPVKAVSIISGHQFNGGLNFDERMPAVTQPAYVFQPSARVEDVAKKNNPGTLPIFTIFKSSVKKSTSLADRLKLNIEVLTIEFGLKPELLKVTSTEMVRPHSKIFLNYGIAETQIRLRPVEQAKSAGDGSGWFAPAGHPHVNGHATFSFEYKMPDGSELEIAEVDLDTMYSATGVERLTMARNNAYFTWNDYLPAFKQAVEADARNNKKKLPPGYYTILGQPQPA